MLFFFKEKPLVVDAFCPEAMIHAYELAPIDYSYKFYPEWWKKLEKLEFNWDRMRSNVNMKYCVGMMNEYQNSLMIPLWSDLAIKWSKVPNQNEEWRYQYSDNVSSVSTHPSPQRGDFKRDHFHAKIQSPWMLKSKKGVLFQWKDPYYNFNKQLNYDVLPGTLEFYNQHATHINLLLKPEVGQQVFIEFGTPMVHLRALSERKIVLKRHLISNAEHKKMETSFTMRPTFAKSYSIVKNKKEKKCPFGFGK